MTLGWAILLACLFAPSAFAQTLITRPTRITATNLAFENQSLIVSATELILEGAHRFQSLLLTNGATLTHPTNTPAPPDLILADHLAIAADSAIQLTGRGLPRGQGSGAGPSSACCSAGGSHGGRGGPSETGLFGRTHGSIMEPTTLGSGSGLASSFGSGGASGGGGIRITASGFVHLDGQLIADGSPGPRSAGGGSGGSVWIRTERFTGSGFVSAQGGLGEVQAGGGGGGRIALVVGTDDFTGSVSACGGGSVDGGARGGAGTIYRKNATDTLGTVTIDNCDQLEGITEVDRDFTLNADLQIRAGATLATRFDTRLSTFHFLGNVTVETNGAISASGRGHPNGFGPGSTSRASCCTSGASHAGSGGLGSNELPLGSNYGSIMEPSDPGSGAGDATTYGDGGKGGGALRIRVDGGLQVDGRIESEGTAGGRYAGGGSGGSLWISGPSLSGAGTLSVAGGNGSLEGGGGGGGGRLAIDISQNTFAGSIAVHGGNGINAGGSGTAYFKLEREPRGRVILDNGDRTGGFTEVGSTFSLPDDLVIRRGAILAPRIPATPWNLRFAGNVHIQAGGSISATARGFPGGQGEGSSPPVSSYSPGGSHGGQGGAGNDHVAPTTHGDWLQPVTPEAAPATPPTTNPAASVAAPYA